MALYGGIFDQKQQLLDRLHQPPACTEPEQPAASRWTLRRIQANVPCLQNYSLSGIWRLLRGTGLKLRAAQVQAYSPDPEYLPKVQHLRQVLREVAQTPEERVALFVDQMGYGRWPQAAPDWTEQAPAARKVAERFASNERKWRLMGALNAWTGQVHALDNYIIGRKQMIQFLRQIDAASPFAKTINVILDNWSIHRHDEVQQALLKLPRLQFVWLPTYAPWLTPIEKLWRWLRQDILYLHRQAGDWLSLQARVHGFLDRFADGSDELLRYVGLKGEGMLAQAMRAT